MGNVICCAEISVWRSVSVNIVLEFTHKQENLTAVFAVVDISLTDFAFCAGCALTGISACWGLVSWLQIFSNMHEVNTFFSEMQV